MDRGDGGVNQMKFKLQLTTADGQVLESWNLAVGTGNQRNDEYDIAHPMHASVLMVDLRQALGECIQRANQDPVHDPRDRRGERALRSLT
jgi:hypothetical protein